MDFIKNDNFSEEMTLAEVPFGYYFTFECFFSAPDHEIYQRLHYDCSTNTIECINYADRTESIEVVPDQIVYLKCFGA